MRYNVSKFARIVSTVFIPPSFTLITFTVLALYLESENFIQVITIATALILGFILPIALYFILRKHGKLVDKDASIKEERTLPFIIAIGFYTLGFFILIIFDANIVSIAFWFCYISNTLLTIIINNRWKISAHTMGATGPLAAITYVFGPIAMILSFIVLLVGWSRINLRCHTIAQVISGALLAFISTYLQIYFISKYFG